MTTDEPKDAKQPDDQSTSPERPQFRLTAKQLEAVRLASGRATNIMLEGGGRSGKTFVNLRNVILRALKAPGSRHAVFRFRFNSCKQAIVQETLPDVMRLAFPTVRLDIDRSDWFQRLPGGAEIWYGGLDDKDRVEKILGKGYSTLMLSECSQIPFSSREAAMTRLAQKVMQTAGGKHSLLPLRAYYDQNPGNKGHWTYRLFHQGLEPVSGLPLANRADFVCLLMNPADNRENISEQYFTQMEQLSGAMQRRFLRGEYADLNPDAIFDSEWIDRWRVTSLETVPAMQRIVVAVDPSGKGDDENSHNDDIGIVVVGLGMDGVGYVIEDATVGAGPAVWGGVVASAFERHEADLVVGEVNFGGAMVNFVVQAARPKTPYKPVTASRGKVLRAEPIAPLFRDGRLRICGYMPELEEELALFSTRGYMGARSPNRADSLVFAATELFGGIVAPQRKKIPVPVLQVGRPGGAIY